MLFKQNDLDGIARGDITVAFRRWTRPTVKTGGILTTAVGVLAIAEVAEIDEADITEEDARRAGRGSRRELLTDLARRSGRPLYRVRFSVAGEDPRVALRNDADLSDDDVGDLAARLDRMDKGAKSGAWTRDVLRLIGGHPKVRAPELAERVGAETLAFKANVRKLKALGLTESLPIGYRLSPRGRALLERLGVNVDAPAPTSAPAPAGALDSAQEMVAEFERLGVMMQAAKGPVPTLAWRIAGEPLNKSWWGHPRAQRIFDLLSALDAHEDSLGCRLFQGKKVWLHRRVWPHLACLAPRLPQERTAVVQEEHTARGAHRVRLVPLLDWLPEESLRAATALSEEEALDELGWWLAREMDAP